MNYYPQSSLLQLVPARVHAALQRLREGMWREVGRVRLEATEARPAHRTYEEARGERLESVATPCHWGKLWDQRWFRLTLPGDLPKRGRLYLQWMDQAEATLYADGLPIYGFDVAHRRAPLPLGVRELWVESVVCQTGVWHHEATGLDSAGSRLEGAAVCVRDDERWDFWHDLQALDDLMRAEIQPHLGNLAWALNIFGRKPGLEEVSPLLRRLLRILDDALDVYEREGAGAARRFCAAAMRALPASSERLRAVLTGHAHIDLVWLWPENVGEFKAVHTFATANTLMELYPEFKFGYSQPASYEAVGRRAPGLLAAAKQRIREGRWDAEGATEVESDTLLACGEALARSFLIGQRRFTELKGSPSRILWLPDVFGYSPCLPQLMRETGVEYFFTTKLAWSAVTRFPYTSFVWRGHDGSEVVSHVVAGGYNQGAKANELRDAELSHRQSDVHGEFLAPTGFGDGGGGTTEEMCERARRYANLAGVPRAEWGNLQAFFDRLGRVRGRLPVYQGELYLEYHRGTYTTHGDIKAGMRAAERALQVHEAVRCALGGGPIEERAWRRVVFAQFHDYIPGSSIHEVYAEARVELAEIRERALEAAASELGGSAGAGGEEALFNPLPRERVVVLGPDGRGGVEAVRLAPLAGGPVRELPRVEGLAPVRAGARRLENGRVLVELDALGRVSRMAVDGRELALRGPLGELVIYPDHPAMFEAWDIDRYSLSLGEPVVSKATMVVERADAACAVVACRRALGGVGEVVVRYRLEAGSPVLRIGLELDWWGKRKLLKMLFPTAYAGREARYGAPFGSVRRPQIPEGPGAEAQWEVPASRWAAVADDTESDGLFVVTEAKYGFSCRDGVLGLSLVRGAAITCGGAEGHGGRSHPANLRRVDLSQKFSDLGEHRIELAVGRHDVSAPRGEQAAALADILFTAPLVYRGVAAAAGLVGIEGGESLQPVWAKPAEAGGGAWVLRLNEMLGRRGSARVRLAPGWTVRRVDLRERPARGGLRVAKDGATVEFGPYALVSLLFSRR